MTSIAITVFISGILSLLVGGFFFFRSYFLKIDLTKREQSMNQRMYELSILKEIGERIGYSLDVQNIVDIITNSLHQFIKYSVVSYMFLEPEKIVFKAHLEESVSKEFINDVQDRMLGSLSALLDKKFNTSQVQEVISGSILIEKGEPVRSFFNIPLVIGEKVVGVLTVAHTKSGLYKEEEMTILYKIISQASNAVTRLQEVVETEQRKLNAMVESMSEGVIMTDKDYRIMVVNPAAKKYLKLSEKKEISIFEIIDAFGDIFAVRGKLEKSLAMDQVLITNDILINDRYYQIIISPVKSTLGIDVGNVIGSVVILHDITHEKEIERMREDFTSMMVHELRTPLGNIKKMSAYVLEKGIKEGKNLKEYISMAHESSQEMLELVNDLLDVAKLDPWPNFFQVSLLQQICHQMHL